MKKMMISVIVVLLLLSCTPVTKSEEQLRVLVDESRARDLTDIVKGLLSLAEEFGVSVEDDPAFTDWRYSFDNTEGPAGFGAAARKLQRIASIKIKKSGEITYDFLKDYDVLIIASFDEEYSSEEADAIRRFVENGGGFLFLAEIGELNNSVSESFGVSFPSESAHIDEENGGILSGIHVTDITSHPITEGVKEILLDGGVPIISYESGEVLARTGKDSYLSEDDDEEGPFDILLAVTVGRGRAVFFGGNDSFSNETLKADDEQNLDLLYNAVKWLGEPGGPFKQYKTVNEQAQQALSNALSLYENREFSQGKEELDNAIRLFEESSETYRNAEAEKGIAEAESYIPSFETGVEADITFEKGAELFSQKEYKKAAEEYEKAESLYAEIGYTERVQECAAKTEATSLFSEGEYVLTTASSTFSATGYEKAKSLFEQSRSTWEEYNDPVQIAACDERITVCSEEISKIKKNIMTIIAVVVIIGVAAVVIVLTYRRRSKAEAPKKGLPPEPEGEAPVSPPDALQALRDQYARGEITREDFERMKSALPEE